MCWQVFRLNASVTSLVDGLSGPHNLCILSFPFVIENTDMSIHLTENAAKQIAKQLQRRGKGLGLGLGVKKAGCSGFSYVVDFADEIAENDQVFEQHGVKLIVKADALELLDGVEVDYTREGLNAAFRFHHPKATGTCGCGESFTV